MLTRNLEKLVVNKNWPQSWHQLLVKIKKNECDLRKTGLNISFNDDGTASVTMQS
jgi:hypothetical protein